MSARRGESAYRAVVERRTPRLQEADVFRRATAGLRHAMQGSRQAQARALADNRRLWITVADLMRDPSNALPVPLRAGIISLGMAVERESQNGAPDFAFLIGVNEHITEGLSAGQ